MSRVQPDQIDVRRIVFVGLALAALVVGVAVVLGGMQQWFGVQQPVPREARTRPVAPIPERPRIQQQPRRDYLDYLEEKRARMESYGWVDREAGRAHIPVQRAMELRLRGKGAP